MYVYVYVHMCMFICKYNCVYIYINTEYTRYNHTYVYMNISHMHQEAFEAKKHVIFDVRVFCATKTRARPAVTVSATRVASAKEAGKEKEKENRC